MKDRYLEFDIARIIALVLMPLAHITESFMNSGIISAETFLKGAFILKIASMGAFVFMCMLGVNLLLTGHNTPKDLAKRGCLLLLMGIGLNLARYIIPGVLGTIATGHSYLISETVYYSIASDILYFASLSFFFFSLMKKLNIKWYIILLIGCLLNFADQLLPTPVVNNEMLSAFLGNFTYINEDSIFAFTQWFVVVGVGYAFGTLYLKQNDKKAFYKKAMAVSSILLVVTWVVCRLLKIQIWDEIGCQYESYNLTLLGVFILVLVYLFLQGIVYFASIKIKNQKAVRLIVNCSRCITVYYIIHWIIICWVSLVLAVMCSDSGEHLAASGLAVCYVLITAVSMALALLIQRKSSAKGGKA